jgi:hypothetical protein
MARAWLLLLALSGAFVATIIAVVLATRLEGFIMVPSPAARSQSEPAIKKASFFSELSPEGFLKSPDSPEPMHIAAAQARSLFRATRWDEFVVSAQRLNSADRWTVHIEPKSGGRDDIMWVTGQADEVKSFGFRRREKLKGYTGKSKKGAVPGFCR